MRIIEEGKEIELESKCPICECRFEFGLKDLKDRKKMSILTGKYSIKCPSCGVSHIVDIEKVRELIKNDKRRK